MEVKRKKVKVIMLPTTKADKGCILVKHKSIFIPNLEYKTQYWLNYLNINSYHLYFTSDEEIKVGSWYLDNSNQIRQSITNNKSYWDNRKDYKKIIATTNKSLNLSQPSQAFVKKYCELGGIEEVEVEYNKVWVGYKPDEEDNRFQQKEYQYILKVNSYNEITIHSIKNSWTREEVSKLISKYWIDEVSNGEQVGFSQWIKNNL